MYICTMYGQKIGTERCEIDIKLNLHKHFSFRFFFHRRFLCSNLCSNWMIWRMCALNISEVIYGVSRVALWGDVEEKLQRFFFYISFHSVFYFRLLHLYFPANFFHVQYTNRTIFFIYFTKNRKHELPIYDHINDGSFPREILFQILNNHLSRRWRRTMRRERFSFKRMSNDFIMFFFITYRTTLNS